MARGRLREQRRLIVSYAKIMEPQEEGEPGIDIERFIERGDVETTQPVILPYDPKILQQIAESGKFGA